jgi:hypothetical protein
VKLSINPSGINHDISPAELPPDVWNDGQNVLFENGFTQSAPGWAEVATGALYNPQYLANVLIGELYYWIYAGLNGAGDAGGIGVTDGVTHWDITPVSLLGVTVAGDWTGGSLNGIPVLNNGIDPPMWWDGIPTNVVEILPGWPAATRCAAMRPYKYNLIAMNITDGTGEYPDVILWSDTAEPGTIPLGVDAWTPTPDNSAGSFSVSTTQGGIVDGGEMRDLFMVYKTGSSTVMQYVAGNFVFTNRKAFVSSGIVARNCWAELYGQHYVLTDGDFIVHNGQEVQSLIDGKNRDWLFEQLDNINFRATHIAMLHSQKEVWINFPTSGNDWCNKGLVLDIKSGDFGVVIFDKPISYMARGILNIDPLGNEYDNRVGSYDEAPDRYNTALYNPTTDLLAFSVYDPVQIFSVGGFTREGAPVPVYLQLLAKDMGKPQQLKVITAIWPLAQTAGIIGGTLAVRVGIQKGINDPITWTPATPTDDGIKADVMTTGRYISLELTGEQSSAWRLNSIDIDYELAGLW